MWQCVWPLLLPAAYARAPMNVPTWPRTKLLGRPASPLPHSVVGFRGHLGGGDDGRHTCVSAASGPPLSFSSPQSPRSPSSLPRSRVDRARAAPLSKVRKVKCYVTATRGDVSSMCVTVLKYVGFFTKKKQLGEPFLPQNLKSVFAQGSSGKSLWHQPQPQLQNGIADS